MSDVNITVDPGGVIRLEAISMDAYRAQEGQTLGISGWLEVSQEMIDRFADNTGDRQFIQVDPVRARGPRPLAARSHMASSSCLFSRSSRNRPSRRSRIYRRESTAGWTVSAS